MKIIIENTDKIVQLDMMLVERLRAPETPWHARDEAAQMILSLSQERDRLREALAPFAEVAERHSDDDPDEWPCGGATLEDARRARAALNKEPPCQET